VFAENETNAETSKWQLQKIQEYVKSVEG